MYDIPDNLLHAGRHKNLTSCPYQFYSTELYIPSILSHRLGHQFKNVDPILYPDLIQAHYYLVPQYSTCHYHQCIQEPGADLKVCKSKAADYIRAILDYVEVTYPFWDRNQGTDHLFIFAWDFATNLFPDPFLRSRLASSIHLTHIGTNVATRYFDPTKDICIPPLRDYSEVKNPNRFQSHTELRHSDRPIFAYFRGEFRNATKYGNGIRHAIKKLGIYHPHHYYVQWGHSQYYWNEIGKARFALCPPGWASWSPRLFDAIISGAIPIIISDEWAPPFTSLLNYTDFSIRLPESNIYNIHDVFDELSEEEETRLRGNLGKVFQHFVYSIEPFFERDAFEMIYETLSKRNQANHAAEAQHNHVPADDEEEDQMLYLNADDFYDDEEVFSHLKSSRVEL